MNRKNTLLFSLLLSIASFNANAFNPAGFFEDLFNSKPGGKLIDNTEGKDVSKFAQPDQCKQHYVWGAPKTKNDELTKRSLFLCRDTFAIQFDPKFKIPLWSSEELRSVNYEIPPFKHNFKLILDDELPTNMQIQPEDFLNTGLIPLQLTSTKNISINRSTMEIKDLLELNLAAIEQNYKMSNVVPVVYKDFYDTVWKELEDYVYEQAKKTSQLRVVTGVMYVNGKHNGVLKKSGTIIPTHLYKTIINPITNGSVSYVIPNKPIYTAKTKGKVDLSNYHTCNGGACTLNNFSIRIAEIEKHTNITFFPELSPGWAAEIKLNNNELNKDNIEKNERWEKIQKEQEKLLKEKEAARNAAAKQTK